MEKCILVMDMPSSCSECPIGKNESIPLETCIQCPLGKCVVDAETETIPDWCPLKPMPSKRVLVGDVSDIQKMGRELFYIGYNACIDEILGGSEE